MLKIALARSVFLAAAMSASAGLHAIEQSPDGSWVPEVAFNLGDADFSQTLQWVSGWSYALTAVVIEQKARGQDPLFCPTERDIVESRILLTILNERFKGQRISAEQAMGALWQGLKVYYPCVPAKEG